MDIKIKGIDEQILRTALAQAREGRFFILSKMLEVLDKPRTELSKWAPKIISFSIDPDKVREVIGSGGKVINKIIDQTGVKIDLTDDGTVYISSCDSEASDKAKRMILAIAVDPEKGDVLDGTVVKTLPIGALVEYAPDKKGLIHISKLQKDVRTENVEDVVKVGDNVQVEVIKISDKGVDFRLLKVL